MRVEAKFFVESEMVLPYDLNYFVSSYIYRCIQQSSPDFADWLHNTGLQRNGKSYKPFVFSRCTFTKRVNLPSGMKVKGTLSFLMDSILPEVIQRFIEGAWKIGMLELGNWKFPLQEINLLPPVSFHPKMIYQAISPIVVPIQKDGQVIYCHPLESRFYDSMRLSMANWYALRWNEEFSDSDEICIQVYRPEKFQLQKASVLQRYKEKNVKGYQVPLVIEAPVKMHQVIYESGLGSFGSLGFGMVECLKEMK